MKNLHFTIFGAHEDDGEGSRKPNTHIKEERPKPKLSYAC